MRYYFALIICNSIDTAERLYNKLDGLEFEHSTNKFDLRFVKDDWKPKYRFCDYCDKLPENYKSPEFFSNVLQHTKIVDDFDNDSNYRQVFLKNTLKDSLEYDDKELKMYLASDASESEYINNNTNKIEYKKLNINKKFRSKFSNLLNNWENTRYDKKENNFSISFRSELDSNNKVLKNNFTSNKIEPKKRSSKSINELNFNKKTLKKKKRKNIKKELNEIAKLDLLLVKKNNFENNINDFKINLNDSRMQEMFNDSEFAIDHSHKDFKNSRHTNRSCEKARIQLSNNKKKNNLSNSLSNLVNLIKLKSGLFTNNKKQKIS